MVPPWEAGGEGSWKGWQVVGGWSRLPEPGGSMWEAGGEGQRDGVAVGGRQGSGGRVRQKSLKMYLFTFLLWAGAKAVEGGVFYIPFGSRAPAWRGGSLCTGSCEGAVAPAWTWVSPEPAVGLAKWA